MRQHNRPGRCTDPSAGVATNQPVVANPRRRGEPSPLAGPANVMWCSHTLETIRTPSRGMVLQW